MYSSIKNKIVNFSLSFISCIILFNVNEAQARAGDLQGTGTAFAISKNSHLATNFHVINGMSEIIVFDRDKKTYTVEVLTFDAENDLGFTKNVRLDGGTGIISFDDNGDIQQPV
ncbi:hypothetical protein ACO0LG_21940 [Undibacterium sp. Ji42W]|uniref:hypothetical protein n=1 Tax=Undibacterium sp. Ji42W TaxID=3413039 RepID=UPI003BF09157